MTTEKGEEIIYKEISYKIRGACFEVYKKFGGEFKELIINKALVLELRHQGLQTEVQKRIPVVYREAKIGVYIPDIIVEDKVLIELKTKPYLTSGDERQFWYYLRGSQYKLGFLINFSSKKLEIKRRIYDKAREKQ